MGAKVSKSNDFKSKISLEDIISKGKLPKDLTNLILSYGISTSDSKDLKTELKEYLGRKRIRYMNTPIFDYPLGSHFIIKYISKYKYLDICGFSSSETHRPLIFYIFYPYSIRVDNNCHYFVTLKESPKDTHIEGMSLNKIMTRQVKIGAFKSLYSDMFPSLINIKR